LVQLNLSLSAYLRKKTILAGFAISSQSGWSSKSEYFIGNSSTVEIAIAKEIPADAYVSRAQTKHE